MKPYNLLDERWIPVRRASGREELIAPFQLSDPRDPILSIATVRPDFDGALLQFLIGLVQATAAPASANAWRAWQKHPPSPSVLKERFGAVHEAFFLSGPMPRFMQDQTFSPSEGRRCAIAELFIDRYEAKGRRQPDAEARALSLPAAAAALLTLQVSAPVGGSGHMASPRGGGPLTTVLLGRTLWETVWLNVLCEEDVRGLPGDLRRTELGAIFPWMGRRTGEDGVLTHPDQVHPLHIYWAMPRRIVLDLASAEEGTCDLTGATGPVVFGYWTRPRGIRYRDFRHPLTPYRVVKHDEVLPVRGGWAGVPYHDWPSYSLGDPKIVPARVVTAYIEEGRGESLSLERLRMFGYHVLPAQTVATAYWDAETPLLYVGLGGDRERLADVLRACTALSETVRMRLQREVGAAQGSEVQGSLLARTFWSATEPAFVEVARALQAEARGEGEASEARESWLRALYQGALSTFDTLTSGAAPLRVLDARRRLASHVTPRHPDLRAQLGLAGQEEGPVDPLSVQKQAAAPPPEPPPPNAWDRAVFRFWLDLQEDARDRAELRRAESVEDVLDLRAFHRLRSGLADEGFARPVSRDRLAVVAAVLSQVRRNAAKKRVGQVLSAQRVSEQRFRQLLALPGGGEQLRPMLRLLQLLNHTAPVLDLSRSILNWGQRVRAQWAEDFYTKENA